MRLVGTSSVQSMRLVGTVRVRVTCGQSTLLHIGVRRGHNGGIEIGNGYSCQSSHAEYVGGEESDGIGGLREDRNTVRSNSFKRWLEAHYAAERGGSADASPGLRANGEMARTGSYGGGRSR
jgi:hypothetical protein